MSDTVKIKVTCDIPSFVTVYSGKIVKIPSLKKGTIVELPRRTAIAFILKHRAIRVD